MPKKIDEVLKKKGDEDRLAHLRKRNAQLENQMDRLRVIIGEQKEIKDALIAAVEAAEPFKHVEWKTPAKAGSPVAAVLELGDWHTGEIIQADETEGINSYSWKTQQRRVRYIISKWLEWVETQRTGYRIDVAHIPGLADWVSGDIHKELQVTNEFPSPVAAVHSGMLLGECLNQIAPHFAEVHYVGIDPGNHDRMDHKPPFKQRAKSSWGYVVNAIAHAYTKNVRNLNFIQAPGIKYLHEIARHNFLFEHGDVIKGWAGFPYYGMGRIKGKEAMRRMKLAREDWRNEKKKLKQETGFDYYGIGHFHVEAIIESDTIVNGALTGTTEFDHGCGRYAKPCQVAYLVHPSHGLFNFVPFRAE